MERKEFTIRINRRQTVNGRLLSSMNQKDALKTFSKNKKFTDDQIKKAHAEAKAKAKELDGEYYQDADADDGGASK